MLYVVISVEIGFIIQLFLQRVSSEGKTVTGVESSGADQRPSVLVGLVTRPAVSILFILGFKCKYFYNIFSIKFLKRKSYKFKHSK